MNFPNDLHHTPVQPDTSAQPDSLEPTVPPGSVSTPLWKDRLKKWSQSSLMLPSTLGVLSFGLSCFLFDGKAAANVFDEDPLNLRGMSPDSVQTLYTHIPLRPFTLMDLENHPERAYQDIVPSTNKGGNQRLVSNFTALGNQTFEKYQRLLETFVTRQGEDDNFSIRVYDQNENTLEIVRLDSLKQVYERQGWMNWDRVDEARTRRTSKIREDYKAKGYGRDAIQPRWGRRNQVMEARMREENLICFELKLAKRLGLSNLVTEIGTVETFNQDWLVSSVGARGRYQFMPSMLRTFGIEQYSIKNMQGGTLQVREERNPLLTMEASMTLVRAYSNAVGHELPGVSAYHTGPGNIYKLYQIYLANRTERMPTNSVAQAFVWGLTTGFPIVSKVSSFKNHSQGYVPSLYGSMRAVEKLRIDPKKTISAELVQVSEGVTITLSEILELLRQNGGNNLHWAVGEGQNSLYQKFRALNPQFQLPEATIDEVPQSGNLVFNKYASNGDRIRFFLPSGATTLLERINSAVLDERATQRFDHTTFLDPVKTGEKLEMDYQYDDLVRAIGRFGFTQSNRDRLNRLASQIIDAAVQTPTPYRRMQARVVRIHRDVWNTSEWQAMANAVAGINTEGSDNATEGFNF